MSVFVPFQAFRPIKKFVEKVASKPYDVLNTKEAREESEENEFSFYHVNKPEIDFPDGTDPYSDDVYLKGKENLEKLIQKGILVQDDAPNFYIYQIKMGSHTQTGLVGCCSIDDYFNNVIKKHELTKPAVEQSRKKHITISEFTYEPVFFSYSKLPQIDQIVLEGKSKEPEYDFLSSDGNQHTFWLLSDPGKIMEISRIFKNQVPHIYIADGHHRTAAGALAGKELREKAIINGVRNHRYDYLMCVLFPHDQVQILDYNRVVKDLNGLSKEDFIDLIKVNFEVEIKEDEYRPDHQHEIGMFLDKTWFKLKAKEGSFLEDDPIDQLGFTILSKYILEPILNIVDLRRDKRIDFVGGIRGLGELEKRVNSGEMKVAFAMHPISMKQLMNIADQNLILPPKVTWFEPKLRSGLFVHSLNSDKFNLVHS